MSVQGEVAAPAPKRRRKAHPRLAQMARTWYFFRRNTLALVGLAVLVLIAGTAVYALTQPLPWYKMPVYCASDWGPGNPNSTWPKPYAGNNALGCSHVCTYEVSPPPNAAQYCDGQWYKTPLYTGGGINITFASFIPPTITLSPFSVGPMPLGGLTTQLGGVNAYDTYRSLLRGADWSLAFSVSIVGIGALVGLLVGAVAGFFGGVIDDVLMRIVDVFLSIPVILFVVVVVVVAGSAVVTLGPLDAISTRLFMLIVGFALVWWPFYARLVRGQVLVVREQKYVEAARASGASKGRILFRHIVPNSVYPIFIQFSLDVGTIPLLIGGLVFLGFGPELFPFVPFPEWGSIAAVSVIDMQEFLGQCFLPSGCAIPWWQLFFPGLALFMFAISVNLLSDGLRDALDPRLRR